MVRPRKKRKVSLDLGATYFKPRAIPLSEIGEIELKADEIEAMRLCDLDNLSQKEAAKRMKISQSTLQRIISLGRRKVSQALVEGKAIKIEKIEREKP